MDPITSTARPGLRPPTNLARRERPHLRPGLPRAWRDLNSVQVGLAGSRGAVLSGLRDGDEAVLACLDGCHDIAQVEHVARGHGVSPWRVAEIVRTLRTADLLVTDPDGGELDRVDLGRVDDEQRQRLSPDLDAWACTYDRAGDGTRLLLDRGRRHVRIDGAGRIGSAVAAALSAAGVGRVSVQAVGTVRPCDVLPAGAQGRDVGSSPADTTARLAALLSRPRECDGPDRSTVGTRTTADLPARPARPLRPAPPGRPDLVVLLADQVMDARRGDPLMRADTPHLAVVTAIDRVVVGPLVLPGRGPCLRCLDLHRRDRDPAWPVVAAQLLGSGRDDAPRCETALATTSAGLATLQVLTLLDQQSPPASHARTLEMCLPNGLVRSRTWVVHPSCGCTPPPWETPSRAAIAAA